MFNFKKQPTVKEIHKAFDNAENEILAELKTYFDEFHIRNSIKTEVERKAEHLIDLGFVNSQCVLEREKYLKERLELREKSVNYSFLNELKTHYPNEKFITEDVLDMLCTKYNLVYAPVKQYVKDIPEKNVLEMKKAKVLLEEHSLLVKHLITKFEVRTSSSIINSIIKKHVLNKMYFIEKSRWNNELYEYEVRDFVEQKIIPKYGKKFGIEDFKFGKYALDEIKFEVINHSGLFIAAPKSHFDLSTVNKKNKHGYFNIIKTVEKKDDPIVFQYCKNGFIRIITKWGTEDDQSYLDPALLNETMN